MSLLARALLNVDMVAVCDSCHVKHRVRCQPHEFDALWSEWTAKHPSPCITRLRRPHRRLRAYRDNANINQPLAASANFTITLASLATDTNLLAGREGTVYDRSASSLWYPDDLFGAQITCGTTPTANTKIEVWLHGSINDTPLYVSPLTGSDAGATMASIGTKQSALYLVGILSVDSATSDRKYNVRPTSVAAIFGGIIPKLWGPWVVHNTAVNLNATAGNHIVSHVPGYYTSA